MNGTYLSVNSKGIDEFDASGLIDYNGLKK